MAETLDKLEKKGQEVVEKIVKKAEPVAEEAKKKVKETAKAAKKTTGEVKKSVKKTTKTVKESEPVKKAAGKVTKVGKQVSELLTPDKTAVYVQYLGHEYDTRNLLARAKEAYIASDSPAGPVRTLDLYVKPEDNAAYYVINGECTGSVEL